MDTHSSGVVASSNVLAMRECLLDMELGMNCVRMKRRLLSQLLAVKHKMTGKYIWISRVYLQVGF